VIAFTPRLRYTMLPPSATPSLGLFLDRNQKLTGRPPATFSYLTGVIVLPDSFKHPSFAKLLDQLLLQYASGLPQMPLNAVLLHSGFAPLPVTLQTVLSMVMVLPPFPSFSSPTSGLVSQLQPCAPFTLASYKLHWPALNCTPISNSLSSQ